MAAWLRCGGCGCAGLCFSEATLAIAVTWRDASSAGTASAPHRQSIADEPRRASVAAWQLTQRGRGFLHTRLPDAPPPGEVRQSEARQAQPRPGAVSAVDAPRRPSRCRLSPVGAPPPERRRRSAATHARTARTERRGDEAAATTRRASSSVPPALCPLLRLSAPVPPPDSMGPRVLPRGSDHGAARAAGGSDGLSGDTAHGGPARETSRQRRLRRRAVWLRVGPGGESDGLDTPPRSAGPKTAAPGAAVKGAKAKPASAGVTPRCASPRLASPRLASPRLASPRLASPRHDDTSPTGRYPGRGRGQQAGRRTGGRQPRRRPSRS
ncbi:hypothetical protein CXG81DRAFT_20684 [Caulochytrium protostelioides]|uniref:Uncharacterized protein n=1 Tax=Caulochytrium protostelioides TaxID=1555241 RepID=A0A4P9X1Y0_9FUNG|nr:hypothetical protein CXG81DRAFT_20684 [Caulochytrium protostelioides]|eukprot:RKO99195.1 hypothetical protein CXG81DRAFT_20684 [Caulochytrium protostelioides]